MLEQLWLHDALPTVPEEAGEHALVEQPPHRRRPGPACGRGVKRKSAVQKARLLSQHVFPEPSNTLFDTIFRPSPSSQIYCIPRRERRRTEETQLQLANEKEQRESILASLDGVLCLREGGGLEATFLVRPAGHVLLLHYGRCTCTCAMRYFLSQPLERPLELEVRPQNSVSAEACLRASPCGARAVPAGHSLCIPYVLALCCIGHAWLHKVQMC